MAQHTPSMRREPGTLTRSQLPDSRQPVLLSGARNNYEGDPLPAQPAHTPVTAQGELPQAILNQPHATAEEAQARAQTPQAAFTPTQGLSGAHLPQNTGPPIMQPDSQQWQLGGDGGLMSGPVNGPAHQMSHFGLEGLNSDPLLQPFGSAVSDLHGQSPQLHERPSAGQLLQDEMQQALSRPAFP